MSTYRLLTRLVMFRPGLYLMYAALAIGGWLLLLVPAYVSNQFFDALSEGAAVNLVWGAIAIFVMANLARVLVNFGNFGLDVSFRSTAGLLMRKNLLRHILKKPAARALPNSAGEAISRFREDVEETTMFLGWAAFLDVVGVAVFAVIALVIMLSIDPLITCVVFLPLTIIALVAHKAGKRIDTYRQTSRAKTGGMTGYIGETFGAVQAVQVAGAEASVLRRFRKINAEREQAMIKESVFSALLNSVFLNIVDVGTGVILLLAAASMQQGTFTVGEFAAFTYYLTWISQLTRRFGMLTAKYKQVGVSFGRMKEMLQHESEEKIVEHGPVYLKEEPPPVPFVKKSAEHLLKELRAENLTYLFPDTKRGVRGVDLQLARGTLTVITGRVGSGKTTLLRAVLGLLPLQDGALYWNGEQVANPAEFMTPPRCAYTPQVPRLFSDSLKQNVLMGLPEGETELAAALETAVMGPDLEQLKDGLETEVGARGVTLSGGQRQRTAAARMFVRTPELYVMDDLSSALDVETEQKLWERLLGRHRDATCLVASHRPAVLRRADRILVLRDGELVGDGTLQELLETCEEMKLLWEGEIQ